MKMDATVNDFLNEINELVPPSSKKAAAECDWQECFDENTGFPYYWNISSDEVQWEMPEEYKLWLETGKAVQKTTSKVPPLFPAVSIGANIKPPVKIYKIETDSVNKIEKKVDVTNNNTKVKAPVRRKPKEKKIKSLTSISSSDSEDEKIVLISSYGGDTESEESEAEEAVKEEEVEAELVKENVIEETKVEAKEIPESPIVSVQLEKPTPAFALVASYGDESDDEEPTIKPPEEPTEQISHSTLFPVTKPIDINQFLNDEKSTEEKPTEVEDIDQKAFQRKRRIGVSLMNVPRKQKKPDNDDEVHRGFGFKETEETKDSKGVVSFVKSDTLFIKSSDDKDDGKREESVEEMQTTLKEKLQFLSEGREAVSPVQVMLIQLETLYEALKSGSLKSGYLSEWINGTYESLVRLEEESAPDGWLLQWDRTQKRYYYRNAATNQCQWDYPQPRQQQPHAGGEEDDAMDICTTPPPQNIGEILEGVLPEKPATPPPPVISTADSPLMEMLNDASSMDSADDKKNSQSSDLSSALDSFYSDIAAIESTSSQNGITVLSEPKDLLLVQETMVQEIPKKKKKVKLSSGTSLKNKGVSKLVEKWKNVQKDLD